MIVLAFDTATPSTVVGVARGGELLAQQRHDPAGGERPGHTRELLALCALALDAAGLAWADVDRIGAGVGPGTFTGLRIGIATARALGQATGAELVAVPTLRALAMLGGSPALSAPRPSTGVPRSNVLACLDARRGEAFVAAWDVDGRELLTPAAWRPERLAGVAALASGPWRARGDGADRFAAELAGAGVEVEPGARVEAAPLVTLAAAADPVDGLLPDYVRAPDAVPRAQPRRSPAAGPAGTQGRGRRS